MKNASELIADLKATAAELAALKDTNTVHIVLVTEGDNFMGAVGGSPKEMVKLIAQIMVRDEKFLQVVENAVELAPLIALEETLSDIIDNAKPCQCLECVAERAANPNVN